MHCFVSYKLSSSWQVKFNIEQFYKTKQCISMALKLLQIIVKLSVELKLYLQSICKDIYIISLSSCIYQLMVKLDDKTAVEMNIIN